MYSFSYLEPVCCSMSSSNCCFLICIQISQEAGQVVWYSHLLQNFPQFIVIHTVKGFGIGIVSKGQWEGHGTRKASTKIGSVLIFSKCSVLKLLNLPRDSFPLSSPNLLCQLALIFLPEKNYTLHAIMPFFFLKDMCVYYYFLSGSRPLHRAF